MTTETTATVATTIDQQPITRALTILDPYSYLVVAGWKPIENRTWIPRGPDGESPFRGRIAIHTSKSPKLFRDHDLLDGILDIDPQDRIAAAMDDDRIREDGRHLFHLGYIVGSVEVVDVVTLPGLEIPVKDLLAILAKQPTPSSFAATIPQERWVESNVLFILRNPRRYRRAIPAGGKQGLWRLNEHQRKMIIDAERDLIPQDDPGCPAERAG